MARNRKLEEELDRLDLERIRTMDAAAWHTFLRDDYFRWKYTAPNRYASTTRFLRLHVESQGMGTLNAIRQQILTADTDDIEGALTAALRIPGLGTAGASGLLALMFPGTFGTVDQFVVKALSQITDLPEQNKITKMKPETLKPADGALLIRVMRRKAAENSRTLAEPWTPRMVDKVLWGYRDIS